ncbi:hypothetical protein NKR19_g3612 [Coniochaeta hoffmannii]|uniref:Uncharacterized protein n=1 Tax=Coniochaeta hoffmannii TaxID=91930 RepID=A0AA38VYQ3_9PEZI|nr:hypothetical protein NKR19_g3612 [Coniochaeta hoffmannii]
MGFPAVHHQQPAPLLRKKASIRDRFRSLARESPSPSPTPIPQPEKKRAVYVPKHAAADFSRLALSPRPVSRQQQRFSFSYDEPRDSLQEASEEAIPIAAEPSEGETHSPPGPRHHAQRGLETLDENAPARVRGRKGEPIPETDAVQPGSGNPRQQRQGQAAVTDFGAPSAHPTYCLPAQVPEDDQAEEAQGKERQQPSDYELFLARAEERERAHRERLLRTLSQRQYPRPEPPEPGPPHQPQPRNSATYTADSAVVADASNNNNNNNNNNNPLRKGWEGRVSSGLDSGIGSKSSSQQTKPLPQQQQQPDEHATTAVRGSSTWERGHRKRGSWTPSFGAGGRDGERRLERDADVLPEEEAYQGGGGGAGAYTTSRGNAASYGDGVHAGQQPRTLKRQTSIKQKLGAYIKPARPPTRYEELELTRGKSIRRT